MTDWTVVTRAGGRGQFRKTGFVGTWAEASDHARTLPGDEVWVVTTEDTDVLVELTSTGRERRVKIAPTAEERAAAKAEASRQAAIVADLIGWWLADRLPGVARAVVPGFDSASQVDAARALAAAGWDRAAVARRLS